jgi:hypothetical protein
MHMHFLDAPATQLWSTSASQVIRIIGDLSCAFLDDRLVQCLSEYPTSKMVFERAKATPLSKAKGRLAGRFGDIVVHASAQSPPTRDERVLTARL